MAPAPLRISAPSILIPLIFATGRNSWKRAAGGVLTKRVGADLDLVHFAFKNRSRAKAAIALASGNRCESAWRLRGKLVGRAATNSAALRPGRDKTVPRGRIGCGYVEQLLLSARICPLSAPIR